MADSNSVPRWGSAGSTLRFEAPDLLVSMLVGDVSAADTARLAAEARRHASGRSFVLALFDIGRLGTPTHEARRVALDGFRNVPTRGMAFHSGAIRNRVLPSLVTTALNLFSSSTRNPQCPVRFFGSEAEARAWLTQRRDEMRREGR
jgi:hypothetical protein